ncbi:MAG: ribonuclease H-like domain-containing protein, partial [Lachnospiraceae bacterium]|nr:ribonuclease H-like domain-containing protein [Lachnospiraceae bacterium]
LIARSKGYDIDTYFTDILENMPHTDIYRAIKPYKKVLHLASIKQTSIERFLGIKREDEYSGKELIDHYINYINGINADKAHLDFILLHNRDDIVCAARIIPILSYMHIFVSPVTLTNVECKDYTDLYGNSSREFYISFKTKYSVPKNHVFGSHPYFVSLNGNTGKIRVPLFEGELKLFFEDYKNYYYLPEEDTAVHKSIAAFSDKENRVKAKPETAYVKARGEFLPQADKLFTPVLKEEFKSKDLYFELKKGFTDDTEKMQTYLNHILSHLKYR